MGANINPHGMIDMFGKLKEYEIANKMDQKASAFDSHPDLGRRIGWLEAKWKKTSPPDRIHPADQPTAKNPGERFSKAAQKIVIFQLRRAANC
ncbi:MAG: hypothetical protein WDM76_10090 [Limisphaerales bacterium]